MQNVLSLRHVPQLRELSDAPARVIEGMLQIHPSDRSTVGELCECAWVIDGGELPPVEFKDVEVQMPLCTDCEPTEETGFLRATLERRGLGFLCGGVCLPQRLLDRRLLVVAYTLLCGLALWWTQHTGPEQFLSVSGSTQQFELA